MWVQDKVKAGDFKLVKILGTENPADMLTKHISREDQEKRLRRLSCKWEAGRAATAPKL